MRPDRPPGPGAVPPGPAQGTDARTRSARSASRSSSSSSGRSRTATSSRPRRPTCPRIKGDADKKPFRTVAEIEAILARGGLDDAEAAALWDCLYLTPAEIGGLLDLVKSRASKDVLAICCTRSRPTRGCDAARSCGCAGPTSSSTRTRSSPGAGSSRGSSPRRPGGSTCTPS